MRSFTYIKNNAKIYEELRDEDGNIMFTETGSTIKYESYNWEILSEDEIVEKTFRSMVNTINKYKFGKLICVYDTSPYYNSDILMTLGGITYKSDRQIMSEELINNTSDMCKKASNISLYKAAEIRKAAKKKLRRHLERIGISTISQGGYEADFIANILTDLIKEKENSCALLLSNDTDWQFYVKENVDFSDCNGNIVSFEEMSNKLNIPECNNNIFNNLYLYKATHDSMFGNHNALIKTVKNSINECDEHDVLESLNNGNFENLFDNIELFKVQYKSFLYWTFPYYDDILKKCKAEIENPIMDLISTQKYSEDKIYGINEEYYNKNIYSLRQVFYY